MFKLILLCDYTREPERRLLKGLSDYANQNGGWIYFQIPGTIWKDASRKMEVVKRARDIRADAIFGRWEGVNREISDPLGIPVVLRTVGLEYDDYPMLSGDYREIGHIAASFFLRQHYENYAFLGFRSLIWSEKRLEGFREMLSRETVSFHSFMTDNNYSNEKEAKEWLVNLPKPIALFAANDLLASRAAEWCQETGISVPEELSILGADNDEFLCNIACPKLSSINLDFERQGYELGETLFRMRNENQNSLVRINVHPLNIVERESTFRHRIQDAYIKKIVDFIDLHYDTPITIEEIVRDIPLSRRAIEIRFKRSMAPDTILSYLTRLRVKSMCNYLCTSDMTINMAAEKAGFTDVINVGRTFKKYTGMSPAKYRNKYKESFSGSPDYSDSGNEEN